MNAQTIWPAKEPAPEAHRPALLAELHRILAALAVPDATRRTVLAIVGEPGSADGHAVLARRLQRRRRERVAVLGDRVCSDRGWQMLLELFASELEGRPLSLTALAAAAGGPPSTTLRQIEQMVEGGLILRRPDPDDRRRQWVEPSPAARAILTRLIDRYAAEGGR